MRLWDVSKTKTSTMEGFCLELWRQSRYLAKIITEWEIVWPSSIPILHGNKLMECDRLYCFFSARLVLNRERLELSSKFMFALFAT